ncbi:anti-sigma factor family protein [Streptomyces sp. NPDC057682]|uniref:anti-sigma factor family protein n=1 Tax=Streptomyces sp. NPDC057682 TaxID=3346210 RepID=UPI0036CE4F16
MTSTADTTRHPDVSEISDLTEGLLPASRTADLRRHLEGCEPCADVLASLEEIRGLLGSLPAPEPMPMDIAARIDAALAEEARSDHSAADPEAQAAQGPDASPASPADDVSRETEDSPSAPEPADRPAGYPRAATGPGRGPTRRRRRRAVLGAALGAAVVGVSALLLQNVQLASNGADSAALDQGASASKAKTRSFSQATLENQVRSLLGSGAEESAEENSGAKQAPSMGVRSSPENPSSPSDGPRKPLRTPTVTVPACVEQGIGRNTGALALQRGTYEGTDAFLVVLPHPTDSAEVQAYVVDASCVGAEPPSKGKILLTDTYTRP